MPPYTKHPGPERLRFLETYQIDVVAGTIRNRNGNLIGYKQREGRYKIGVLGRQLFRSHIIWWKAKGYWPRLTIDHENRIKSDDWIGNLREATMLEQAQNKGPRKPYKKQPQELPAWVQKPKHLDISQLTKKRPKDSS